MNKKYIIAFVVIVVLIAGMKYMYDKKEKERARIEKLNNDLSKACEAGKSKFDEAFKPTGNTVVEGLRDMHIGVKKDCED